MSDEPLPTAPHEPPSLGLYFTIVLRDGSDGEVLVAVHQLRKLAKAAGLDGHDIAQAIEQRGKLLDAAKALRTERDQARAEVERLKRLQQINGAGNSFAQQLWQTAGMPTTIDNRHAQWLLDLHAQGRIYLNDKAVSFVTDSTNRRRFTPAQRDWLTDLVRTAIARTGQAPP